MNGQDLSATCLGEGLSYGVVQDVQGYRYFTVDLFSIRPLGQAQCAIDSDGAVLFGFRIQELAGCGHVSLVNNAYTALNNSNYYISLDGWDVTGEIITDPIPIGNCPPCEPPAITLTSADSVPYCGVGVHLAVEASGASLYGTDPTYITGSVRCLWKGDVTMDGVVKYTGTGNDRDAILVSLGSDIYMVLYGYYLEDVNMDGLVRYTGMANDRDEVLDALGGSDPNAARQEQLP